MKIRLFVSLALSILIHLLIMFAISRYIVTNLPIEFSSGNGISDTTFIDVEVVAKRIK